MLHHIVQATTIKVITVHFLVKGHTENDADTIHSIIERNSCVKLFLPDDCATVIQSSPKEVYDIDVKQMTHEIFFDFHEVTAWYKNFKIAYAGEDVLNWMKVAVVKV